MVEEEKEVAGVELERGEKNETTRVLFAGTEAVIDTMMVFGLNWWALFGSAEPPGLVAVTKAGRLI